MKTHSLLNAVLLLVLCTFFWGSSFPIGKDALTEVHALTLVLWRFVIAALCLALYLKIRRSGIPKLQWWQWSWVITVSAVGVGGLNLGLFTGLSYTSSTNGSLIMALSPLTTALIACVVQRSLPSMAQGISVLVSLSGVLLVISNGQLDNLLHMQLNHGDKLVFFGMLAWSFYTYCSQGISRWMPVLPYTFIGMVSGAVVIGAMCLASADVQPWTELWQSSHLVFSEILYVGLFGTVAGYLLWLNGISKLGSANAAVFFNLVPIFAVLTSLAMGQSISSLQWVGMMVVLAGLLLPRLRLPKRAVACSAVD
ncbi:DMT family transporter [Shewanella sp.]|uniref:DMT family transporter n=1 Tax=Shewanella sp. TaxID=50422 RepID=UPI003A98412B